MILNNEFYDAKMMPQTNYNQPQQKTKLCCILYK